MANPGNAFAAAPWSTFPSGRVVLMNFLLVTEEVSQRHEETVIVV
jgi:hypothetical protein